MVPNKIIQRTFHIAHGDSIGTGFTIDVDGRQYLATARHVISDLESNSEIGVLRNGEWQQSAIGAVWHSPTGADVSLISLQHQLSPPYPIKHVGPENNFYLSQQIFFLGFPYGMHMEAGQVNDGFPVPFVKTGIVANFSMLSGGSQIMCRRKKPDGVKVICNQSVHLMIYNGLVSEINTQTSAVGGAPPEWTCSGR